VRENPVLRTALAGPTWLLSKVRAPHKVPRTDIPGVWPGSSPES